MNLPTYINVNDELSHSTDTKKERNRVNDLESAEGIKPCSSTQETTRDPADPVAYFFFLHRWIMYRWEVSSCFFEIQYGWNSALPQGQMFFERTTKLGPKAAQRNEHLKRLILVKVWEAASHFLLPSAIAFSIVIG